MMSTFQIIPVQKHYIEQIIYIANSYHIDNLTKNEIDRFGFLVSGYNFKDYLSYLKYADYFLLCIIDENVAGFTLAYSDMFIKKSEGLNKKIQLAESEAFVLIKQICVAKEYLGKGIAKKLYEYLFENMKLYVCYAVIVIEPLNRVSIKFHEKLGFRKHFENIPTDGLKRGVWKRTFKK